MAGLRVLITNNTLARREGSELYVRDVATALIARGHTPIAYSTVLGDVAGDLRAATVPVIDDLDLLAAPPDVIHGQHHLETMTALLRFPGVPAISFCHGWQPWEEAPPRFPRILRYVAVDETCRDRLVCEHGIPDERVCVILNFVDLHRFVPRSPLPAAPRRALIFNNQANEYTHLPAVREACARAGIPVAVLGLGAGTATATPEQVLGDYDLVFAKGRSALEAMATGAAVILCDRGGSGPMVTVSELERLRALNFGIRALRSAVDAGTIEAEIKRYDAADAGEVSRRIRATAGRESAVDRIVSLYEEVRREFTSRPETDADREARAASAYLRSLSPRLKEIYRLRWEATKHQEVVEQLRADNARLAGTVESLQRTVERPDGLASAAATGSPVRALARRLRKLLLAG